MNAIRRKEISRVLKRLNELVEDLIDILGDIENIKDEETEALDNIPESLQETERYAQSEAAVDNLEDAYDTFSDMRDSLDVACHAKYKKVPRKIQKNLLWVKKQPLDNKSRGCYYIIVRISEILQPRALQISSRSLSFTLSILLLHQSQTVEGRAFIMSQSSFWDKLCSFKTVFK